MPPLNVARARTEHPGTNGRAIPGTNRENTVLRPSLFVDLAPSRFLRGETGFPVPGAFGFRTHGGGVLFLPVRCAPRLARVLLPVPLSFEGVASIIRGSVGPPPVPPADLYSAHADLIERILTRSCRTHRLPADAADEFCSWARLRLIDHDQAILRKFSGRSTMRTFLLTVVERLFLDWRNHEWGKWRPTNEARRLGDLAIELEKLVLRDHHTLGEAVQTLVARGVAASEAECERVWARLPRRPRRQRVEEALLGSVMAQGLASDPVEDEERRALEASIGEAIERAVRTLSPGDQLILRLRFWSGFKIARIAELVGEDAKALYRGVDRICLQLKQMLEADGVRAVDAGEFLGTFVEPDDPGE